MKYEGASTTIYYSKDNPNLIRDKFKMTTTLLGIAFLSIFVICINVSKTNSRTLDSNDKKGTVKF